MKYIPFSLIFIILLNFHCDAQHRTVKSMTTDYFDVIYNRLEFDIDPGVNYIKGCVTVYFVVNEIKPYGIELDLIDGLHVDSIIYKNRETEWKHRSNVLTITTESEINIVDSLSIYYQGNPDPNKNGSFVSQNTEGQKVMWTLSEPYGARDWWPCKQSLTDKIDSIDIIVTTLPQYRTASNGVLVADELISIDGKQMRVNHWKHRHPVAAYLVAIAVTDYVVIEGSVEIDGKDVPIINYVYPDNVENGQEALEITAQLMQLYSDLFIPYPYSNEKYGHAQFGWGGGMEHQTMSFMVHFGTSLVAHELAHQWFGDYITCGSWSDLWLNEGFATYLQGMSIEYGIDDDDFEEWLKWKIDYITMEDVGSVYVKDTIDERRLFSSRFTYSKGAYLLHMLRWELGDEVFFESIRNYLNDPKLSDGYAYSSDLQQHFEIVADTSLTEFFDDWLYGEGFPIYNIYWKNNDEEECVFVLHQHCSASDNTFFEMHVPIRFVGDGIDSIVSFYNTQDGQEFVLNPGFEVKKIEFNPGYKILSPNALIRPYDGQFFKDYLFVFPNPATDKLVVNFSRNNLLKEIAVYDSAGKKVRVKEVSDIEASIEFDIANLASGVYVVVLQTENEKLTKKFVK